MPKNIRKKKINDQNVSYLNRDFESLRNDLVRYAQLHYGDTIIDYTQSSLAGLLVDLAAYVGDVMSFYMDHNFNELSVENAVEEKNILRHAREAGVEIQGAVPSLVKVLMSLRVPAEKLSDGSYEPNRNFLPKVKAGTVLTSNSGIEFELLDDIDYGEVDESNELVFFSPPSITKIDSSNNPIEFLILKEGNFTSGQTQTDTFFITNEHKAFRRLTLTKTDVTEIISVKDVKMQEYYEVKSLAQDTVFSREANIDIDKQIVNESLSLLPAPRRFIKERSRETGLITLIFGAGNEDMHDEDVIPDPSSHAITLFGERKTMKDLAIDPNSFLGSTTLGLSPKNTTITVRYRHGGGLSHNVAAGSIKAVKTLITKFKTAIPTSVASRIRASVSCSNRQAASGGEEEMSIDMIRAVTSLAKLTQDRVVSREDLLARVYSMPNNFGRVFRATCRNNPNNPFAVQINIISRDIDGKLIIAPDSLKKNLQTYLSRQRLVSDAIDIIDTSVINLGVKYAITITENSNPTIVLQTINYRLKLYFDIKNWQIDQPVYTDEIYNIIINTEGVLSLLGMSIFNLNGKVGENNYSDEYFSVERYTRKKIIYPPPGSIFEVKFPDDDIIGKVS